MRAFQPSRVGASAPRSPSVALGVDHVRAVAFSESVAPGSWPQLSASSLLTVGHAEDEEPLPLVRRARFLRRKQSRRNSVPQSLKFSSDVGEPQSEVASDVLKEHDAGLRFRNDASDVGPKVARIVRSTAQAGVAERLARVAANDAIHDSTPRAAIEGSEVRPHRERTHARFFHAARHDFEAVGVPLNATDDASRSAKSELNPEVESADAGAEGEDIEGGRIHTALGYLAALSQS